MNIIPQVIIWILLAVSFHFAIDRLWLWLYWKTGKDLFSESWSHNKEMALAYCNWKDSHTKKKEK